MSTGWYPPAATVHFDKGIALINEKKIDDAINEFRETVILWPDYYEAHFQLGKIFHEKDLLDEAIVEYRIALKLKSYKNFELYHALGGALYNRKLFDDARIAYQYCIENDYEAQEKMSYEFYLAYSRVRQIVESPLFDINDAGDSIEVAIKIHTEDCRIGERAAIECAMMKAKVFISEGHKPVRLTCIPFENEPYIQIMLETDSGIKKVLWFDTSESHNKPIMLRRTEISLGPPKIIGLLLK